MILITGKLRRMGNKVKSNSTINRWNQDKSTCFEMTLQEIADSMNLTRERVRQIEAKATQKLRKKIR